MRTSVLLAMIPLALAGTLLPEPRSPYTGPTKPSPIAAQAESFRERFEAVYPTHTFAQRWWPGEGVTLELRGPPVDFPGPVRVRTIQITKPPPEPPQEALAAIHRAVPLPEPRPVVRAKPRPIRVADICTRHGMHKQITNGGRSWRCKK